MKFLNLIVLIASFVIIVSFFLPWFSLQPKSNRSLSTILGDRNPGRIKVIRGYEIPKLANRKDSKVMIRIFHLFLGKFEDLDKKIQYIYAVPGIAVIMLIFTRFRKNYKLIALIFFLLGTGVYFISLYKIHTTNLNLSLLKLSIEEGIKYSQYSFLTIGIVGFIRLVFLS